jgi:hypothetical protein
VLLQKAASRSHAPGGFFVFWNVRRSLAGAAAQSGEKPLILWA